MLTNTYGQVVTMTEGDHSKIVPGLYAAGEAGCASVHGANRCKSTCFTSTKVRILPCTAPTDAAASFVYMIN